MAEPTTTTVSDTPAGIPPPAPEPTAADTSLAAHIESLQEPPPDAESQAPPKRHHRVKDIASPRDVPRIRELTGKVKETETRAENAERERDELKAQLEAAKKASVSAPVASAPEPRTDAPARPAVVPTKFSFQAYDKWVEANPTGTWDDWQDAKLEAFDTHKEALRQQTARETEATRQRTESETKQRQAWQTVEQTFEERRLAFEKTHPDYLTKLEATQNAPLSALMVAAIKKLDNGPAIAYALFSRPDLIAEAHLMGDGKPVTDAAVASAQRWLQHRVPTDSTGAVAATPPVVILPTPPTPVRTGPQIPSDEPPPDDAGLAAHKRYYGKQPRR